MNAENPENFAYAQARKFSPRSSGNRTGFSAEPEKQATLLFLLRN
jgi:hypothetical protein